MVVLLFCNPMELLSCCNHTTDSSSVQSFTTLTPSILPHSLTPSLPHSLTPHTMNIIREIERINAKELENGIYGGSGKGSWHEKYKNSAWVYVGGLPYELTEGDIICVMSQWGEIEDINLVREKGTNKSQGFAFVKYEDQRSTILAVDNFNGIQILQRTIRVDHVDQYKLPKDVREREEKLLEENPDATVNIGPGHAYKDEELLNEYSIKSGVDHWQRPSSTAPVSQPVTTYQSRSESDKHSSKKKHKEHKEHKEHKHHKSKHKRSKHTGDDYSEEHKHHKKKKHRHSNGEKDEIRQQSSPTRRDRESEHDSVPSFVPAAKPSLSSIPVGGKLRQPFYSAHL